MRLVVIERVRRVMGSIIGGVNDTCGGGLNCTLGDGSSLGADWGSNGGVGVRFCTLGDRWAGIAGGLVGVGCVVCGGWGVPCLAQL